MAWSTRQLAEIAGTTIKAVRHYHEIGLLDEPARRSNGYKQYETAHLVRLLQIKRLSDLGVPLAQIASMGRADQDPDEALRVLDSELEATITRLQRVRAELAVILRHRAPADLPAGFSAVGGELSDVDRSMLMIYAQVFDDDAMDALRTMMHEQPVTAADDEFQALPADADRATRQALAERIAPLLRDQLTAYPALGEAESHSLHGPGRTESAIVPALRELYHPAQLEVLYRAHLIVTGETDERLDAEDLVVNQSPRSTPRPDPDGRTRR
ncbi:helix-turn-helix domain-containing protein [Promicromonospora sukumoe]|uniref:helix-turn-helix domain-containing protein n=1 Tax=Promicromonospora sukumoe TaxID=88382 RepID=UPI00037E1A1E|nr:MerR family transcriptional regulator [Promicromonospora sukumoe]